MIASEIRFPLLMLIALMMVQSVAAAQEDYSQVDDETRSSQQQGMQENLEDAIRASDREQEQALIGGPNGALIGPNRVGPAYRSDQTDNSPNRVGPAYRSDQTDKTRYFWA